MLYNPLIQTINYPQRKTPAPALLLYFGQLYKQNGQNFNFNPTLSGHWLLFMK